METMLKVWQPGLKKIMANLEDQHVEIELYASTGLEEIGALKEDFQPFIQSVTRWIIMMLINKLDTQIEKILMENGCLCMPVILLNCFLQESGHTLQILIHNWGLFGTIIIKDPINNSNLDWEQPIMVIFQGITSNIVKWRYSTDLNQWIFSLIVKQIF